MYISQFLPHSCCWKWLISYTTNIIFVFIIPPSSGLRLLSYCCKRLLRRNVTFCTVWILSVAFEEIVEGTKIDCGGVAVEKFFFEPWPCSFVFAQLPFSVFDMTAMPLLQWKNLNGLHKNFYINQIQIFLEAICPSPH